MLTAGFVYGPVVALAEGPIERPKPIAAKVIATKGGEELALRAEPDWRSVYIEQNLIGGDALRTNAAGNLAILFEDRTQIRLGRNSTLVVKDVARGPNGETQLALPQGSMWARAARGGSGVTVETPAAAAAIRGTDWSLTAEGKKTALIVLDGVVELRNPQGSVTVRRGEGAEAIVGQAPRKVTLVNFDRREQIMLYRDLSDSFSELSPTDLGRREEREKRGAILARPEAARSAGDWLTLAEIALTYDGAAAAASALAAAERKTLSARERARADLVRCVVEARGRRWAQATSFCDRAERGLDPKRRATATYLAWAARRMADPKSSSPPPSGGFDAEPTGIIARASVESFLSGPKRGIEILDRGLVRFPDDVMMRAGRALLFMMLGEKAEAKKALEQARRIDGDDPWVLVASARYRYVVESDLEGASRELARAREIAPGFDNVWLETSLVEDARGATRKAEEAHLRAIALNPAAPLNHSNYAIFLITNGRVAEAEREIEAAEALDPGGFFNLYARGFLLLTRGQTAEAIGKLLEASAISPDAAAPQIALAIANYQNGDLVEAEQALDNADQFDDDDPLTPTIRSVLAVDQYRADEAIESAREALRRRQARGGDYATIDANRQNGSFVGSALRFLELDEWGRYYGDRVADAFEPSTYFDQAIVNRADPFATAISQAPPDDFADGGPTAFSSLVQGLLLSPLAVASSERRTTLAHHPFFEAAFEAGIIAEKGDIGWTSNAAVQAVTMEPYPVAVYLNGSVDRPDSPTPNDRARSASGLAIVGAQPTLYDKLTLFSLAAHNRNDARLFEDAFTPGGATARPDHSRSLVTLNGVGWSHEFGERNVLEAMVAGTTIDQRSVNADPLLIFFGLDREQKVRQRELTAAVSHLVGVGDVTFRYGVEGSVARYKTTDDGGGVFLPTTSRPNGDAWKIYGDAVWEVTPDLKIEAGLFAVQAKVDRRGEYERLDPRIGVAWQPFDGQWLRAAYRRDTATSSILTLSPITTVGITPTQLPLNFAGRVETLAARWDAEWGRHLFTALEYQRQEARSLSIPISESLRSADIPSADIDRLTASANLWLTGGVGVFATYTRSWTEVNETATDGYFYGVPKGAAVPFLPKHYGRVGVSFVHPSMVKVTVAQNFFGDRRDALGQHLDGFSTTDAAATWELLDKRLALNFEALNIFNKRIETFGPLRRLPIFGLTPGDGYLLGSGRTLTAAARLRF